MTLVEPKPSPRPWFAVWRAERGTFGQLPLLARALFTEILKLTDDEGVIDLGGREPADAIAWALGADRSDRRALTKYVPMLLADGCLVHEGDRLIAPNFERWQPKSKSRTSTEPTTTAPRTGRDGAAMVSRPRHETEANPAESCNVDRQSREEKSREEDRGSARAPEAPNVVAFEAIERARSLLTTGYQRRYERATGEPWMGLAKAHADIGTAAAWVAARPERLAERADALLDAAFADEWLAKRRWPWGAIARDPARYGASGDVEAPQTPAEAELEALDEAMTRAVQRGDFEAQARIRSEIDALARRKRRAQ